MFVHVSGVAGSCGEVASLLLPELVFELERGEGKHWS